MAAQWQAQEQAAGRATECALASRAWSSGESRERRRPASAPAGDAASAAGHSAWHSTLCASKRPPQSPGPRGTQHQMTGEVSHEEGGTALPPRTVAHPPFQTPPRHTGMLATLFSGSAHPSSPALGSSVRHPRPAAYRPSQRRAGTAHAPTHEPGSALMSWLLQEPATWAGWRGPAAATSARPGQPRRRPPPPLQPGASPACPPPLPCTLHGGR